MDKQIIVYEPNEQTKMEVKTDGETVWLTQDQMCRLFGRERSVITKHINNVFKEGELPKEGFVQILHNKEKGLVPTDLIQTASVRRRSVCLKRRFCFRFMRLQIF